MGTRLRSVWTQNRLAGDCTRPESWDGAGGTRAAGRGGAVPRGSTGVLTRRVALGYAGGHLGPSIRKGGGLFPTLAGRSRALG